MNNETKWIVGFALVSFAIVGSAGLVSFALIEVLGGIRLDLRELRDSLERAACGEFARGGVVETKPSDGDSRTGRPRPETGRTPAESVGREAERSAVNSATIVIVTSPRSSPDDLRAGGPPAVDRGRALLVSQSCARAQGAWFPPSSGGDDLDGPGPPERRAPRPGAR